MEKPFIVKNGLVVDSFSANSSGLYFSNVLTMNSSFFVATANNVSFVGSTAAANVVSNTQLQSNLANYPTKTDLTANLANYPTNSNLAANLANYPTNSNLNATLANYPTKSANLSDLNSISTARSNLGLGTVAVYNVNTIKNTIPYINSSGSITVTPDADVTAWSFISYGIGLLNYAGFFQSTDNRQYMQLNKPDGSAGTRFCSNGDTDYVQGYPAYMCRAWVNFNGTGTPAIRAAGNVSSITDNGVGDWTINFTIAMPDANYAFCGGGKLDSLNFDVNTPIVGLRRISGNPSTTSVRVVTYTPGVGAFDCEIVTVAIFR